VKKLLRSWILALTSMALLVGCAGPQTGGTVKLPDNKPNETGVITKLEKQDGIRILVEGERKLPSSEPSLFWVRVDDRSQVATWEKGGVHPAMASDLRVGLKVDVWFEGPIMESYPAQAYAGFILIKKDP
jgi:hypothetical protein